MARPNPEDLRAGVLPFVGRGVLLETLRSHVEESRAGLGQAVLLAGEPGIGKSRLLLELSARADGAFSCHVGRCSEDEGAPAYWVWLQILRSITAGRSPREMEIEHGAVAAGAVELLPEFETSAQPTAAPEDPAAHRFRIFDAVARLLVSVSQRRPLFLVLDDLHRADQSSVLLLQHVVRELRTAPILLVGAYRPHEVPEDHLLRQISAEAGSFVHSYELSGLEAEDLAPLARALLERELDPRSSRELRERTSGNPLFVTEILRTLRARGEADTRAPSGILPGVLPEGVRQVIGVRLATLDDRSRGVLGAAAVIGREFSPSVLPKLCEEVPDPEIEAALDLAEREGFVESAPGTPGWLRFQHVLVRDALYEALLPSERRRLHRRAGSSLETDDANVRRNMLTDLAHHFLEGGDWKRAYEYARKAAERSVRQAAHDEAAQLFAAALQSLGDAPRAEDHRAARAELLLRVGQCRWAAGQTEPAREAFQGAIAVAREIGDVETLSRSALGYAGRTDASVGVNHVAVALLEEALVALEPRGDALRVEVLTRLGTELYYAREPERGLVLTQQAVELAETVGDDASLAYALSGLHYSMLRPHADPVKRREIADRMIAVAERAGEKETIAIGLQERMIDLVELGEIEQFDADLARYERLAEELRQPFFAWMAASKRGMRTLFAGHVEQADALAHETLTLGMSFGTPNALPMYAMQLYCVRREQGRIGEIEDAVRAIVEGDPAGRGFRSVLVSAYAETGRLAEATHELEILVDGDLDHLPLDQNWLPTIANLSAAVLALGDRERARRLYELMEPLEGRLIVVGHGGGSFGLVDHYLGEFAHAMGELERAGVHLQSAADGHRRAGARLLEARSLLALARVRQATDPGRAAVLGRSARTIAEMYEVGPLVSACDAFLENAAVSEPMPEEPQPSLAGRTFTLRRQGAYWMVADGVDEVLVKHSKGFEHLRHLVGSPGQERSALELAEGAPRPDEDMGEQLDAEATRAYRARAAELREALEEAEDRNDLGAAERAREELEVLEAEVSRAVGLGGRARRAGSAAEKARLNVSRAIWTAVRAIERDHAVVGEHLRHAIRTGRICVYQPDPTVEVQWTLQP